MQGGGLLETKPQQRVEFVHSNIIPELSKETDLVVRKILSTSKAGVQNLLGGK